MKNILTKIGGLIVLAGIFSAFGQYAGDRAFRTLSNRSFKKGELLEYRLHIGMLTAGEATMSILPDIERRNGRPCYRIDVYGKTTGLADFLYSVKDNWGTYYDTASLVPHQFYRNIQEGRYRKYEVVDFDHQNEKAKVTTLDKHTFKPKETKMYDIPSNIQDLVSGYYYIRTLDFSKTQPNDTLQVKAFFDKELFDMKIRFVRREVLKTKLGKINSLVFAPVMPENSIFEGEDAILLWMSDDANKIPLKVRAKMFLVGSVDIDITDAKNIKSRLAVVQE